MRRFAKLFSAAMMAALYYARKNRIERQGGVSYVTFDPDMVGSDYVELQNANSRMVRNSTSNGEFHGGCSKYGKSSGKWYGEFDYVEAGSSVAIVLGIAKSTIPDPYDTETHTIVYHDSGDTYTMGDLNAYGDTFTEGDKIGVALDLDSATKTLHFYKNGVDQGVAASGADLDGATWHLMLATPRAGATIDLLRPGSFHSGVPSGYTAWQE